MKTILFLLVCSSAYADNQWFECSGVATGKCRMPVSETEKEHQFTYNKSYCTDKRSNALKDFIKWFAVQLLKDEDSITHRMTIKSFTCEPTTFTCANKDNK